MKRYAYFRYPHERKWHYNNEYEYRQTGYNYSCNMPEKSWYEQFKGLPYITKFYFDYDLEDKRLYKLVSEIMEYGDVLFVSKITELISRFGRESLISCLTLFNGLGINLFVMKDWVDINSTIELLNNMDEKKFSELRWNNADRLYVVEESK